MNLGSSGQAAPLGLGLLGLWAINAGGGRDQPTGGPFLAASNPCLHFHHLIYLL